MSAGAGARISEDGSEVVQHLRALTSGARTFSDAFGRLTRRLAVPWPKARPRGIAPRRRLPQRRRNTFRKEDDDEECSMRFWNVRGQVKGGGLCRGDELADGFDESQIESFCKNYHGAPGEVYSRAKPPVISPVNSARFLKHLRNHGITSVHLQERCGGGSSRTRWAYRSSMRAVCPADMRYG